MLLQDLHTYTHPHARTHTHTHTHTYIYIYIYIYIYTELINILMGINYIRGAYDKFPDIFRMGI